MKRKTNIPLMSLCLASTMGIATPHSTGGVDGGGGFADLNSTKLLNHTASELSKALALASPQAFVDAPNAWNAAQIIHVLSKIEMLPLENRQRSGRPLMFDYDVETGKIIALAPYFQAYAAVEPTQFNDPTIARGLVRRLLHETAHLWGANEDQAEAQANAIQDGLDHDTVLCEIPGILEGTEQAPRSYMFNIPQRTVAKMMSIYFYAGPGKISDEYVLSAMHGGTQSAEYQYIGQHASPVSINQIKTGEFLAQPSDNTWSLRFSRQGNSEYVLNPGSGMTMSYPASCSFHFIK